MTFQNANDCYIWLEATGKPGVRAQMEHGNRIGAVNSHHAGVKLRVHKTEVENYTVDGCFVVCNPQPAANAGIAIP